MYANVFTCPRTLSDFTVEICGYISGLPGRPRYTSYKTIKRQTCRLRVGITRPYLQFQRCQFLPDVFRFGLDDPEEKGKGTRSSSSLAHSYSSSLLRWPSQFIVAHINASNKKLQHIYLLLTLFFTQRKRRILRNVWNSFVLLGSTVVVKFLISHKPYLTQGVGYIREVRDRTMIFLFILADLQTVFFFLLTIFLSKFLSFQILFVIRFPLRYFAIKHFADVFTGPSFIALFFQPSIWTFFTGKQTFELVSHWCMYFYMFRVLI